MELLRRWWAAGLAAGIAGARIWREGHALFQNSAPVGRNGYYFVLQTEHVVRTGWPYLPTGCPLFFYLAAALRRVTGDPIVAIKAAVIGLEVALAAAVYVLAKRLTGAPWWGLAAVTVLTASSGRWLLAAEFPDELCALALLAWAGAILADDAAAQGRRAWLSLVLLGGALLSSPMAALLAAGIGVCAALAVVWLRMRRGGLAVFLALALWALPAGLARLDPTWLPGWMGNAFSATAAWPSDGVGGWAALALLPLAVALLLFASRGRVQADRFVLAFAAMSLFAVLAVLNPFLDTQAGYTMLAARVSGLAFLMLALVSAGAGWALWQSTRLWAGALVVIGLATWAATMGPGPPGMTPEFLARQARVAAALRMQRASLPAQAVVVARASDEAMVTYTTGLRAVDAVPADVEPERVYWLLDDVPEGLADPAMIVLDVQASPAGNSAVVLAPASALRLRLASAGSDAVDIVTLAQQNPQLGLRGLVKTPR